MSSASAFGQTAGVNLVRGLVEHGLPDTVYEGYAMGCAAAAKFAKFDVTPAPLTDEMRLRIIFELLAFGTFIMVFQEASKTFMTKGLFRRQVDEQAVHDFGESVLSEVHDYCELTKTHQLAENVIVDVAALTVGPGEPLNLRDRLQRYSRSPKPDDLLRAVARSLASAVDPPKLYVFQVMAGIVIEGVVGVVREIMRVSANS